MKRGIQLLIALTCMLGYANGQASYSCPGCNLAGSNFSGKNLAGANFAGANLKGANFSNAILSGSVFCGANLAGANFTKSTLTPSGTKKCNFTNADLSSAVFNTATITNARFNYAQLAGTDFSNTDLTTCSFGPMIRCTDSTGLHSPIFKNTKLSGEFSSQLPRLDTRGAILPKSLGLAAGNAQPVGLKQSDGTMTSVGSATRMFSTSMPAAASGFSQVVWVAPGGKDLSGCGDTLNPCGSIGYAMSQVSQKPAAILVMYGNYTFSSTVALVDNVSIFGGLYGNSNPSYQSAVNAPPNGAPVFSANGISTGLTIQGFFVNATPATGSGAASMAMLVQNSKNIHLNNVNIVAAAGGNAGLGDTATGGVTGGNGKGTAGGTSPCGNNSGGAGASTNVITKTKGECCAFLCVKYCCSWSYTPIAGDNGMPGTTGFFAPGSNAASGVYYGCPDSERPTTAKAGTNGNDAGCGMNTNPTTNNYGYFNGTAWSPAIGGSGVPGGNGGGGGGGGNGGPCGYTTCGTNCEGYNGTAGGGGGAGGCGATGGPGGIQGGASFSMVLAGSTINCDSAVTIIGASGGTGGIGAAGGTGGTGGTGAKATAANDVCNDTGGQGGAGGNGGAGGGGSGGAGGPGGPSVGIALVSQSAVNGSPLFYAGTSGTGGKGGTGGASGNKSACSGIAGPTGTSGVVANTRVY